jgi:hypothetical protein
VANFCGLYRLPGCHSLEGFSPKAKEGVSGHGVPQSTPSRYNDMKSLNDAAVAQQHVGGWHGQ